MNWNEVSFQSMRGCDYSVTFAIATRTGLYDFDRKSKLSEFEKFRTIQVFGIAVVVTNTSTGEEILKIYAPPELGEDVLVSNGWIEEFSQLLDGARAIVTFHSAYQYGVLRKYLPFEQRMIYWQFLTFDLFELIKSRTKQWCSLRDLLWQNDLAREHQPDQRAPTMFAAQNNWDGAFDALIKQVKAIAALTRQLGGTKSLKYLQGDWKEIEPGRKEKVNTTRELSLEEEWDNLFVK